MDNKEYVVHKHQYKQ